MELSLTRPIETSPAVTCTCVRCGEGIYRPTGAPPEKLCHQCVSSWLRFSQHVPRRYATARLQDLPAGLVERFRALPSDRGLYLWGPPGTGKTHSLFAMGYEIWHRGENYVRRMIWDGLLLDLRGTFRRESLCSEKDVLERATGPRVLMIDDIGTATSMNRQESDFALRVFLHILDSRLEACRPTYMATNKTIEDLGRSFDDRILSRLLASCEVIKLIGPDRRISP